MGRVLYQYDIMTPTPKYDTDRMISDVKSNLPENVLMQQKVDIADAFFGIQKLTMQFVCPEDVEGIQDILENYLDKIKEEELTGEWELSFTSRI